MNDVDPEWKKKKGQEITAKVKYDPDTYRFFYKVQMLYLGINYLS